MKAETVVFTMSGSHQLSTEHKLPMNIIHTESTEIYTVLIEGNGGYSQTYVFYEREKAEVFASLARQKVYPEYPVAINADFSVYDPVKGFVQENATDAYEDFLDDASL